MGTPKTARTVPYARVIGKGRVRGGSLGGSATAQADPVSLGPVHSRSTNAAKMEVLGRGAEQWLGCVRNTCADVADARAVSWDRTEAATGRGMGHPQAEAVWGRGH